VKYINIQYHIRRKAKKSVEIARPTGRYSPEFIEGIFELTNG